MSKPDLDIIHSPEAETFLRMVTKGFYDNSYIGLWMYEVIGREWDEMRAWAEGLKTEINPQTCTWSVAIWEWVYGIESDETWNTGGRESSPKSSARSQSTRRSSGAAWRHSQERR